MDCAAPRDAAASDAIGKPAPRGASPPPSKRPPLGDAPLADACADAKKGTGVFMPLTMRAGAPGGAGHCSGAARDSARSKPQRRRNLTTGCLAASTTAQQPEPPGGSGACSGASSVASSGASLGPGRAGARLPVRAASFRHSIDERSGRAPPAARSTSFRHSIDESNGRTPPAVRSASFRHSFEEDFSSLADMHAINAANNLTASAAFPASAYADHAAAVSAALAHGDAGEGAAQPVAAAGVLAASGRMSSEVLFFGQGTAHGGEAALGGRGSPTLLHQFGSAPDLLSLEELQLAGGPAGGRGMPPRLHSAQPPPPPATAADAPAGALYGQPSFNKWAVMGLEGAGAGAGAGAVVGSPEAALKEREHAINKRIGELMMMKQILQLKQQHKQQQQLLQLQQTQQEAALQHQLLRLQAQSDSSASDGNGLLVQRSDGSVSGMQQQLLQVQRSDGSVSGMQQQLLQVQRSDGSVSGMQQQLLQVQRSDGSVSGMQQQLLQVQRSEGSFSGMQQQLLQVQRSDGSFSGMQQQLLQVQRSEGSASSIGHELLLQQLQQLRQQVQCSGDSFSGMGFAGPLAADLVCGGGASASSLASPSSALGHLAIAGMQDDAQPVAAGGGAGSGNMASAAARGAARAVSTPHGWDSGPEFSNGYSLFGGGGSPPRAGGAAAAAPAAPPETVPRSTSWLDLLDAGGML